jgi:hypothetical protein
VAVEADLSTTSPLRRLACLSYRLLVRAAPPPGPTRGSVDERLTQQVLSGLCVYSSGCYAGMPWLLTLLPLAL